MFARYTTHQSQTSSRQMLVFVSKEKHGICQNPETHTVCLHPYNWPSTPPRLTAAQHKQAWQLGLSQALLQSHTILKRLQQPLGHCWQRTPHHWPWRYDPILDQVVHLHVHWSTLYQTVYHKRQGFCQSYYPFFHTKPQSINMVSLHVATTHPTPGLNTTLAGHDAEEIPLVIPHDNSESLVSFQSSGFTPLPGLINLDEAL